MHISSEWITTSVRSGIKGKEGQEEKCPGKKKEKKKEEKVKKTAEIRMGEHFFSGDNALLITSKWCFQGEQQGVSLICAADTNFPYKITSCL